MKVKRIFCFLFVLGIATCRLYQISDEFKRLIAKKENYGNFSHQGVIDRIIPVDFNHDGRNEYVFVERGNRRFSVFTSDGFKGWTLANGFFIEVVRFGKTEQKEFRILLAKLSENREQMFLIYDWKGNLVKSITLNNRLEYRREKDEFLYEPYILDINYDSIPEFVFASNYGEEMFIFDINGEQIPKKYALIYFPQAFEKYNPLENPFLPGGDYYKSSGKYYFKKEDPENSDYVLVDEKPDKTWVKVMKPGDPVPKFFSIAQLSRSDVLNNPCFYSFAMSDFNGKGPKELLLGSTNRVYILEKNLSLLRVLKNVFF